MTGQHVMDWVGGIVHYCCIFMYLHVFVSHSDDFSSFGSSSSRLSPGRFFSFPSGGGKEVNIISKLFAED